MSLRSIIFNLAKDWRIVQTFLWTITVSQEKLLHARLVLSLVTLLFQSPYSTFCNSLLFFYFISFCPPPPYFAVPPSCLLASFLPLHLYYPLNNSLCIESCVCSFCSQSPKGVSLEAPVAGRTCFFLASAPSLSLFSAIPLLSGDPATVFSVTPCGITVTLNLSCHQTTCATCVCCLCAYLTICIHFCPWRVDGSKSHSCSSSFFLFTWTTVDQSKITFVCSVMKITSVPLMFGNMNNTADVRFAQRTLKHFWCYSFLSCVFPQGKPNNVPFHPSKLFLKPLGVS